MKTVNIALCGTGNVGSSFMDLVLKNKQKLSQILMSILIYFLLDPEKAR